MINDTGRKAICAECGEEIEQDADSYETDNGVICESCFNDKYFICDLCDKVTPLDDMKYWGDCRICPECLEDECPEFDQEENDKETEEAYQKALEEYVGCKTTLSPGTHPLTYKSNYTDNTEYSIRVTIDDEKRISEISRLTAQTLLWESETSSGWGDQPIDEDDYEWILPNMLDEYLVDEDYENEE